MEDVQSQFQSAPRPNYVGQSESQVSNHMSAPWLKDCEFCLNNNLGVSIAMGVSNSWLVEVHGKSHPDDENGYPVFSGAASIWGTSKLTMKCDLYDRFLDS